MMTYSDDWDFFRTNFSSFMLQFVWDSETGKPTSIIIVSRLPNKNVIFSSGDSLEAIRLDTEKQLERIIR